MSSRTSKLYLYSDDKVADAFQIQSGANDATFSYGAKPVKFAGPIQFLDGVAYQTLTTKFASVVSSVSDEKLRAETAEGLIQGLVVSEAVSARAAELVLRTDLATESKLRSDQLVLLMTADASEQQARISADTTHSTDIAFEVARAQASESVLNGLVVSEASTARAAELKLRTDLATEVADRKTAIIAEQKVRGDADLIHTANILSEGVARSEADTAIIADYKVAVAVEKGRAETAEVALGVRINFLTANSDVKALDSLSEIVNRMNATGLDVYQRLATIELALETLRNASLYSVAQQVFAPDTPPS